MKINNEIHKNYLNNITVKENLLLLQKKIIGKYNEFEDKNNILLNKNFNYYSSNEQKDKFDNKSIEEIEKPINIFNIRLNQTKDNLIKLSQQYWPNVKICKNILELKGKVKIKNNLINNILFLG